MKEKLIKARKILNTNFNSESNQKYYTEKLKDVTEKAELTYNDVKVKKNKSKKAV